MYILIYNINAITQYTFLGKRFAFININVHGLKLLYIEDNIWIRWTSGKGEGTIFVVLLTPESVPV